MANVDVNGRRLNSRFALRCVQQLLGCKAKAVTVDDLSAGRIIGKGFLRLQIMENISRFAAIKDTRILCARGANVNKETIQNIVQARSDLGGVASRQRRSQHIYDFRKAGWPTKGPPELILYSIVQLDLSLPHQGNVSDR